MLSVPAGQEGWLAFDVTTASNHWLLNPRSNLGIRLYVETEEGGRPLSCHATGTAVLELAVISALLSVYHLQIAPYLLDGSGWLVAGVPGPNSPSW